MFEPKAFITKGLSKVPLAFPGNYPTRIFVHTVGGGLAFEYSGKPVSDLKAIVKSQFLKKSGSLAHLNVVEYDQNGVIYGLIGGNLVTAPFHNLYFPIPNLITREAGRNMRILTLLDRSLVTIGKRRMYMVNASDKDIWYASYRRWLYLCAKGKVDFAMITPMQDAMYSGIANRLKGFTGPPRLVPRGNVPEALAQAAVEALRAVDPVEVAPVAFRFRNWGAPPEVGAPPPPQALEPLVADPERNQLEAFMEHGRMRVRNRPPQPRQQAANQMQNVGGFVQAINAPRGLAQMLRQVNDEAF